MIQALNSTHKDYWRKLDEYYNDVIMSALASQITSLAIVYSTIYSGADQRSASQAYVREFTGVQWIPRTKGP